MYQNIQYFKSDEKQRCDVCGTSPRQPALCLLCGEFLCFASRCCAGEEGSGECNIVRPLRRVPFQLLFGRLRVGGHVVTFSKRTLCCATYSMRSAAVRARACSSCSRRPPWSYCATTSPGASTPRPTSVPSRGHHHTFPIPRFHCTTHSPWRLWATSRRARRRRFGPQARPAALSGHGQVPSTAGLVAGPPGAQRHLQGAVRAGQHRLLPHPVAPHVGRLVRGRGLLASAE